MSRFWQGSGKKTVRIRESILRGLNEDLLRIWYGFDEDVDGLRQGFDMDLVCRKSFARIAKDLVELWTGSGRKHLERIG